MNQNKRYPSSNNAPISFLERTKLGRLIVDNDKIRSLVIKLGFKQFQANETKPQLIRVNLNIVEKASVSFIIKSIYEYCKKHKLSEEAKYVLSSKFNLKNILITLSIISKSNFLRDTKTEANFPFTNGILKVSRNGKKFIKWKDSKKLVWKKQIISRPYLFKKGLCEFQLFLYRASGKKPEQFLILISILGYLLHTYKDRSFSIAIIFTDMFTKYVMNGANGGNGKSLIQLALKELRNILFVNGRNFDPNSNFLFQQVSDYTDLIYIDDVHEKFDLKDLYSHITGEMPVEKKYIDSFNIPFKSAPKIFLSTNYPVKYHGNSTKRRVIEFPISHHYNHNHRPIDEFNHLFFEDWSLDEWSRFYTFLLKCCKFYLKNGIIQPKQENTRGGNINPITTLEFTQWADSQISLNQKCSKVDLYNSFIKKNPTQQPLSKTKFKKWIDNWAVRKGFKPAHTESNGKSYVTISS